MLKHTLQPMRVGFLLGVFLFQSAWGGPGSSAQDRLSPTLSTDEREAARLVKVETIKQVTNNLVGDDMQGRGTATPGGEKAAEYIAGQFARIGLKPLGENRGYLQKIKFVARQVSPTSLLKVGDISLKYGNEFVVAPPLAEQERSGGMVFAGYGVVSPDLNRDDLAGVDIKGKVVVVLVGRPKGVDEAKWAKVANPPVVGGNLIRRGAVGMIMVDAGKGASYTNLAEHFSRRRVELPDVPPPFNLPPTLIVSQAGAEKLFASSGLTLSQAQKRAESSESFAVNLKTTATIATSLKKEESLGSNVVAVIEGSDTSLKEQALVFTAHYDAFGVGPGGRIYAGAADNALGVGILISVAEAFAQAPSRPRRSIIFLAVTGEEYGLLGSKHWVNHPTWAINRVIANLNFDGIGTEVYGPMKRITGLGAQHSDLGAVLEAVAKATESSVVTSPVPELTSFNNSDQYAFAMKGIPAMQLNGGPDGDTAKWIPQIRNWMKSDYHQPSDTVRSNWHWDGARTLAAMALIIGKRVANADIGPEWLPASPFHQGHGTSQSPQPKQ